MTKYIDRKGVFMKKNFKKILVVSIILALILGIFILGYKLYDKNKQYKLASENSYNATFYELVNYVQNVEVYLAKSLISTNSIHGAETLTNLWREANLAQTYLSLLPIESQELENTEKFLNQVSDYSYSLSRKNINNEDLTDEDLKNLKELHVYSIELENTLNQLSTDLNSGNITWDDLTGSGTVAFAQQVNSQTDIFSSLEENFHEYSGLIYDGAFSEHLTSNEKRGLTGNEIDENTAFEKAKEFIGSDNIREINSLGLSENGNIPSYTFSIKTNKEENLSLTISKKGGHVVFMNCNRDVQVENLNIDEAKNKVSEFLNEKGFLNMKDTYYINQSGVATINYAYEQNGVIMYADLIKVKIALDDGEILGIETTGYLNSHYERNISNIKISKQQAKTKLNKDLNIASEGMAVIPTEFQTEILCYEFKGKTDSREFLVYINAENGKEEDILIIIDTPNGVLTM